jgi:hypothetical protein
MDIREIALENIKLFGRGGGFLDDDDDDNDYDYDDDDGNHLGLHSVA